MSVLDILNRPWAVPPATLAEISRIANSHWAGQAPDVAAIEARLGRPLENKPQGFSIDSNGVAVIPIDGVIAKRMNLLTQVSGGTSSELVGRDLAALVDNPQVKAIVLAIDSPGGTVDGTQDLARRIHEARGRKPIVAVASGWMASGAYWIGSAADSIYVEDDTTHVGSIGVAMQHTDYSEAYKQRGMAVTDIFAGKYKRISSEAMPLSDEGRAALQDRVDYIYSVFVDEVARYRGVSAEQVLARMADGRIFIGRQAIDAGLVDSMAALAEVVADLGGGTFRLRRSALAPASTVQTSALPAAALAPATFEEQCRQAWEGSEETRADFVTFESFTAYVRAVNDGRVKVVGGAQVIALASKHVKDKGERMTYEHNVEEQCKRLWASSQEIREEFGTFESYVAFSKADAAGLVKIQGRARAERHDNK